MTYITTGGDASEGNTYYKRVDDNTWEKPQATKHGDIASTADNGSGGTTVTCSAAHGMSNGDVVHIFETTDYDGDHTISNVSGADFDISVVYTSSQTGNWTDDNEYYANNQNGEICGETVYARYIEDDSFGGGDAQDILFIHGSGANGLAPVSCDGVVLADNGPHARGFNATMGTTTRDIIWQGEDTHQESFDILKDAGISKVRLILTYIKDAPF